MAELPDLDQIDALLEAGLRKEKEPEADKAKEKEGDNKKERKRSRSRSRSKSPRDRDRDRRRRRSSSRERRRRSRSRDRDRRSSNRRSRSREGRSDRRSSKERERDREREKIRERERKDIERQKERDREAMLDPLEREQIERDRDDRTVFVTNLPLRAYEDDIDKFFSQAGKVRDIRLITDRNSRKSKGFGYVEFFDRDGVPAALSMSGRQFMGQTVTVKPTEAEKNRSAANALTTTYFGPTRLYVGSLHFNVTEDDIRGAFERWGSIEFVDLHKDAETGRSKGFGFVQFKKAEDAKRALQHSNGLEIVGRPVKVGLVNEPLLQVGKAALDEDEASGGVKMNSVDRVLLMSKLQRGSVPQPSASKPQTPVSLCVLLTNMFDPEEETEPNWDQDIKEDVSNECKKFGTVIHCFVDKKSKGHVYLKFSSVPAAQNAINALNGRWFAKKQISATFVPEGQYHSLFPEAAQSK